MNLGRSPDPCKQWEQDFSCRGISILNTTSQVIRISFSTFLLKSSVPHNAAMATALTMDNFHRDHTKAVVESSSSGNSSNESSDTSETTKAKLPHEGEMMRLMKLLLLLWCRPRRNVDCGKTYDPNAIATQPSVLMMPRRLKNIDRPLNEKTSIDLTLRFDGHGATSVS